MSFGFYYGYDEFNNEEFARCFVLYYVYSMSVSNPWWLYTLFLKELQGNPSRCRYMFLFFQLIIILNMFFRISYCTD